MRYLLGALSSGNFLIELLPRLFELIIAQVDLFLKIFKIVQRDSSFVTGLVDMDMFQSSRRKKSPVICQHTYKYCPLQVGYIPLLEVIKPSSESMMRR